MNRRIKTEEPSKSTKLFMKMSRAKTSTGSKLVNPARAKIKTPIKKKTIKNSKFIRDKSQSPCYGNKFDLKVSPSISRFPLNTKCTTSHKSLSTPSHSTNARKSVVPENIYQISDSSDDDDIEIIKHSSKDIEAHCAPINLCETDDSMNRSKVDILDEILHEVKSNNRHSYPSTSTAQSVMKNEVPDFIDNLLDSNEDLLDENYLKSLNELNDQNEKLLQSSWNLINNTHEKTFEDSVIFVSTEDSPRKPEQNLSEASAEPVPDAEKITDAEKQVKTSCPICLEKLGSEPVSSTICGHIFCTACIKNCIKSQKKCPTCRKHLTIKMVHPLFLF